MSSIVRDKPGQVTPDTEQEDDLGVFQGLRTALPVSLVMWALIIIFAWMAF
jgi:hypothetical protein